MIQGNWVEVAGHLPGEDEITSLAVFNGTIFGSTYLGSLLEWNGTNAWSEVASAFNSTSQSLTVFNGNLYAVASDGTLIVWNGVNAWTQAAPSLGGGDVVVCLCVFGSSLYGCTTNGGLVVWNGLNAWVSVIAAGLLPAEQARSLCVFNGNLYCGTSPHANLWQFNNVNAWIQVAPQFMGGSNATGIFNNSLTEFNGQLYAGTTPDSELLQWNNANAWNEAALGFFNDYTNALIVFDGALFAGVFSIAGYIGPENALLVWDGVSSWNVAAPSLNGQAPYALCVFNGNLYCGTLGSAGTGGLLFVFVPTAILPTVNTDPAANIQTGSAQLNGNLSNDGGEACTCGFQWGLTVAYGNTTPTTSQITGETFDQVINVLVPGTTYHYRAFATNSAGTAYGSDLTFSTLPLGLKMAYPIKRRLT
jgi:hypothetical protein